MKIKQIPADTLALYRARKITSATLAELTGLNAGYCRRAIKRDPPPARAAKGPLIAARKLYRESISHLPAAQIAELAHTSLRTAQRIKRASAKLSAKGAENHDNT
jgi:hypothetical protein